MTHLEKVHIPVWLLVSGCAVFFVPCIYFVYDKYCKDESGGPLIKSASKYLVISYLLCGLAWSIGKSRTATDMDGTLHTDLWKSETSREGKKSF